jgi:hypothetical protein
VLACLQPRSLCAPLALDRLEPGPLLAALALDRLQPLACSGQRPLQTVELARPPRLDALEPRPGLGQLVTQSLGQPISSLPVPGVRERRLERGHPAVHLVDPAGQPLLVRERSLERVDLLTRLVQLRP